MAVDFESDDWYFAFMGSIERPNPHERFPSQSEQIRALEEDWAENRRWHGIQRNYTPEHVVGIRTSLGLETLGLTFARYQAEVLFYEIQTKKFVPALGALTGSQAEQYARAGMPAIYMSGWQVAADANQNQETLPDMSLYAPTSGPILVRRINNALMQADRNDRIKDPYGHFYYPPIVADCEAGFGGKNNAFKIAKDMIEAGAAGIHFEDQLSSEKKCGHLSGKVVRPASRLEILTAARLAADVLGVPTVLVARTDVKDAKFLDTQIDPLDDSFLTGERTSEGFYHYKGGMDAAIVRGLAYAPYADLLWYETKTPDKKEAQIFAEAIHKEFPGKPLAYNLSPSIHWKKFLSDEEIATFMSDIGEMGYKFQFVTLAGWHLINTYSYKLARDFVERGMSAYVDLQEEEFRMEKEEGYTAVRHQESAGVGYYDKVATIISSGKTSTLATPGSTEDEQFRS